VSEDEVEVEVEIDVEVDDVRRRTVAWPAGPVSCGAVLDGFAAHCRDELADVELLEHTPRRLRLRWRDQTLDVALRPDPRGCDRLPAEHPWLLVVAAIPDGFVDWFVDRPGLADRIAVYGLDSRRKLRALRNQRLLGLLRQLLGDDIRHLNTKLNSPRLEPVPVRVPLPTHERQGSIYEVQSGRSRTAFG
jgi:hypothetical protein